MVGRERTIVRGLAAPRTRSTSELAINSECPALILDCLRLLSSKVFVQSMLLKSLRFSRDETALMII